MDILYKSTRGSAGTVTASQAILKGLADDGGLYVPVSVPELPVGLDKLSGMDYKETAYMVMKEFLTDFSEEELKECINNAYDSKFDIKEITRLTEACGAYYLELYHGATIAFKDMALSILPHLMTCAARKNDVHDKIIILTATSGDTGKAALAGFADVPGTGIIVFYPKHGVSPVQEKQMVTQRGNNTYVVGIEGNFDDAQTGVKNMFGNSVLASRMAENGYRFSSANSINIGRLVPQIVYYVYAYGRLVLSGKIKPGDKVNYVVPTGNFGNILAAFYAKCMGIPVGKLICASNENKVLYDFFESGTYDKNREFVLTSSPSMDILISSNLERLIYIVSGEDGDMTRRFMESLVTDGRYSITAEMKEGLSVFYGGYATESETASCIKKIYDTEGYVIDTHTAVAACVYDKYRNDTKDDTPCVIASTASPYKFARSVMCAIDKSYEAMEDFELINELSRISGTDIPKAIEDIRSAPVLHNRICEVCDMQSTVEDILGL